jgi:hypothetical protein
MKWLILCCWLVAQTLGSPLDEFLASATKQHGEQGERAAQFLIENMPDRDRETLSAAFLTENLNLAFQARSEFPWAAQVPEAVFLNDVLPYAVFDETRDPWRADLLARGRDLVKEARTASEAAQALNRQIFNLVKVH